MRELSIFRWRQVCVVGGAVQGARNCLVSEMVTDLTAIQFLLCMHVKPDVRHGDVS